MTVAIVDTTTTVYTNSSGILQNVLISNNGPESLYFAFYPATACGNTASDVGGLILPPSTRTTLPTPNGNTIYMICLPTQSTIAGVLPII